MPCHTDPVDRAAAGPARPETPGAASDGLERAVDRNGRSPRSWLAGALAGTGSPVLDLARPSRDGELLELRHALDQPEGTAGTVGPALVQPGRLPLRTNGVAAARLDMCLPLVVPLDDLFAELRRVLRPTGTLAALVPARPGRSPTEVRAWWPLRRVLRGGPTLRHESACDNLGWLLTGADFAVLIDLRRTFGLPVPDGEAAVRAVDALTTSGVWSPDLDAGRLADAKLALARYAAPGRALPVPLRLLVARR